MESKMTGIKEAAESNEQLQGRITELEGLNRELVEELSRLREEMRKSENEATSAQEAMETQLQRKNEQNDELRLRIRQLQKLDKAKEESAAMEEIEMGVVIDQMSGRCHKLEIELAESTRDLTTREPAKAPYTSLSDKTIPELRDEVKKFTVFARHMFLLAAQHANDNTSGFNYPFETMDLEHIYEAFDRFLNGGYDEMCELRARVADVGEA